MAKTNNPDVHFFNVKDVLNQDDVDVILGPYVGMIKTCKWARDENGEAYKAGTPQTITLTRQALIGLAYEILQAVK